MYSKLLNTNMLLNFMIERNLLENVYPSKSLNIENERSSCDWCLDVRRYSDLVDFTTSRIYFRI